MNPPNPLPPLDEAAVLEVLRQVMDPEIGCNLVDLGLIYNITIVGGSVTVEMTLTTQGCPMHESLTEGARHALLSHPAVTDAEVRVVWDPPWSPSMMTEAGRRATGLA